MEKVPNCAKECRPRRQIGDFGVGGSLGRLARVLDKTKKQRNSDGARSDRPWAVVPASFLLCESPTGHNQVTDISDTEVLLA